MALGVDSLVVDEPKIIAFSEVVAQSGIDAEKISQIAILNESIDGKMRIQSRPDPKAAYVRFEALVAVIEPNQIQFILRL